MNYSISEKEHLLVERRAGLEMDIATARRFLSSYGASVSLSHVIRKMEMEVNEINQELRKEETKPC